MPAERTFLKEARKAKGLTMKVLAQLCEISEGAYCNVELGKRNVSVAVAKKIAKVLDIDWTAFY
jgi:transcriptional regulator with XRE-family HTH domain